MEKSVYNEMIRQLNEDKKRLYAEIEQLDKAINSLTILKNGVNHIRLTDDILTNKSDKNTTRKNYYEKVDVEIPISYSSELQTMQLFFYTLNELGAATVDEMTNHVMRIDSTRDHKHIFSRFRDIASGLYRAKKIYADNAKKKFKYSLKEIKGREIDLTEKINREIDAILKL